MLGCKQLRAGQTPARANPQDGPNPSIGQTPSQERRDLLTQKSARKVLTAALLFQVDRTGTGVLRGRGGERAL